MIIGSQVENDNSIEQMLEFYKKSFDSVEVVTCDKCDAFLAFELVGSDGMGMTPNAAGKYVVPIGDKLMSHRVRLDEAPTGEPMIGYQCACGNDTRISKVEEGLVPVGLSQATLSPFERHRIKETIRADKKHKAKFSKRGKKKKFETFTVERVK